MKLKDFFTFGSGKANGETSTPFLPMFGRSYQLGGGNKKYLDEYRNWVFACVQARAEAVGDIQLELYDGDKEIEDYGKSDLLTLLYKVNPTMTMQDLFMGTQAYLDLDGNAFWYLARDKDGKGDIQEIWLLRPDKIEIVADKENPLLVAGYVYRQSDGTKIPFDVKNILHFKNFNPLGEHPFPHRGMGIVQASQWSIDTDNESRVWNYSFFKNSARPDGFLTTEGTMGAEDFKRLKEQWEQSHRGSDRAHKTALLTGGLKWEDISRSQKDMDFLEQRRFSRDEILALFRVPKSVIGIVEDVNRANAEASNYIFASRTVDPLMKKIVATINEFLVPEFGDNLYLEYESPVPEDRAQTINEYVMGIDKWLTRNEIREEEGLEPSKEGDQIWGTLAQMPIDSVAPTPKKSATPRTKHFHRKNKSTTEDLIDEFVSKLPTETDEDNKRQLSETAKANYVTMWKQIFDVEVDPLKKKVDAYLADQAKEVIGNIVRETKGLEAKEFKYKAIDDLMFDEDEAIETGINFMTPELKKYLKQAGEQGMLLTGAGQVYDATTPSSAKFVKDRAKYFAETFTKTTQEKLFAELQAGLEANESTAELSERVAQFYDGEASYRSERTARTEISASGNWGAQDAYEQAGVKEMEWLVVNPEDEDCLINNGEHVKIGEAFPSGDAQPPVHPNCVCALIPYFGN